MNNGSNGVLEHTSNGQWHGSYYTHVATPTATHTRFDTGTAEWLRQVAWEIGERRPADHHVPSLNHVGLAMVFPYQGFAHWHIRHDWIENTAWFRGDAWRDCQMILRLYDVSHIEFNGLNAHSIQDRPLPCSAGQMFFPLSKPGTWQIAEVGFLLRSGEFIPAARSQATSFAADSPSAQHSQQALLVKGRHVEDVGNLWDQERIIRERLRPRLKRNLRIGHFALTAAALGHDGSLARFVSELARGQVSHGHEAHVFVPAAGDFSSHRHVDGVHYHPLALDLGMSPVQVAGAFGHAARQITSAVAPFDFVHVHEWMAGQAVADGTRAVLSLSSLESTRRQGAPLEGESAAIAHAEKELAQRMRLVLTPDWLRDRAAQAFAGNVRSFAMEGRGPNGWELPCDPGQVKMAIGIGPLDRMLLFVGPLDHGAGVDIVLDALPVLLQRWNNVRLVYVGEGEMHGRLKDRAHHLGIGHAVRWLGDVEGSQLTRLLRSAETLVLPSRYRVPQDDAVVDLARLAGKPVITTHGGPAHLVRHEENGIVTYDNPGSMVWAIDRILGDPAHGERLGAAGRRIEDAALVWSDVTRHYLELCAATFPELTETPW